MDRDLHRPEFEGTDVLAHQVEPGREFFRGLALGPFRIIFHDIVHLNDTMIQHIYTMSIDIIIFM